MKKLLSLLVVTLVSTFVLVGCNKPADETTVPPADTTATNTAPAAP